MAPVSSPARPAAALPAHAARSPGLALTWRVEGTQEALLQAVADASRHLLADDFDAGLAAALATLGDILGLDRVYVVRYDAAAAEGHFFREWTAPGMPGVVATLGPGPYPLADYGDVWRPLLAGDVYSTPVEAKTGIIAATHLGPGTKSDLFVPIVAGTTFWGTIGFDDCTTGRRFAESEVHVLRGVAAAIAAALARRDTEARRLAAERARADDATELSRLLEGVVAASRALLEEADFRTGLQRWLAFLAQAVGADRAVIGGFAAPGEAGIVALEDASWIRPGFHPPTNLRVPATADFLQWRERLAAGETIRAHRDDLADAASRRFWTELDCFSQLLVPVIVERRTVGWLGFDWRRRHEWKPAYATLLRTAADGAASALKRNEAVRAMLAEREARTLDLSRANTALRHAIAGLASIEDLGEFLASMLRESMGIAGALGGAVVLIDGDTVDHVVLFGRKGRLGPEEIAARGVGRIPYSDGLRAFMETIRHDDVSYALDPDSAAMPESFRVFHREEGNRAVQLVPMRAGDRLLGWVGLGFADTPSQSSDKRALLRVLGDQMTLSVEMIRLAEELKRAAVAREQNELARARARHLEAHNAVLRRSAARLSQSEDTDAVLGAALAELAAALQADVGHLFVCAPEERTLHLKAAWRDGTVSHEAVAAEPAIFGAPIPYDTTGAFARLCETRRYLSFAKGEFEGLAWPGVHVWFAAEGFQDAVVLALTVGERPVGLFACAFRRPREIAPAEGELLYALAAQIALAVDFARLAASAREAAVLREREHAERRRATELARANDALRRSTARLVAEGDLDRFLCALMAEATAATGAKSAGVFTYDDATERLQMTAFMTEGQPVDIAGDPRMEILRRPVPPGIVRPWVRQLQEKNFAWFAIDTPFPNHPWPLTLEWHRQMGHRLVVTVPLYAGGRLIGTFGQCFAQVIRLEEFDYEQTRILANHAALALQLAGLSEQARTAALQGAVLHERNRIARDLHDTLAQGFTGVLAQLGAAEGAAELHRPEQISHYLERAKALARFSLAEARSSVHALRPETAEGPLRVRFQRMLSGMTHGTGLHVAVREHGDPRPLGPVADWCAHKFVQEAIANAVKHSGATEFAAELEWGRTELHLRATDNGCGFDQQLVALGVGLLSMRERAAEAGGRVVNESRPGHGTHLVLHLPLPAAPS